MSPVRNPDQYRDQTSQRMLFATLWITLFALVIKGWIGAVTASLCLLADTLHTVIDACSVLLSLLAVSAHDRHQRREVWGHDRIHTSLAFGLAALLGFGCLGLLGLALKQLLSTPSLAQLPPLVLPGSIVVIVLLVTVAQLGFATVQRRLGQHFKSPALRVNAQHLWHDAWLSGLLIVTLWGINQGYTWADPATAIAGVITAIFSYWRLLNMQLPLLVRQVAIAPEAIAQIVRQVQGVTHCDQLRSRGLVGRQVWIDMKIVLHPEFISSQNRLKQQIEAALRDRYGPIQVMIDIAQDDSELNNHETTARYDRSLDWR